MRNGDRLKRMVEQQVRRIDQAERDRPALLAQTVFLGMLALLFVVPLVAGAYVGHWIDTQQSGYSYRWTMWGLGAGLTVGIVNVYLYVRRH